MCVENMIGCSNYSINFYRIYYEPLSDFEVSLERAKQNTDMIKCISFKKVKQTGLIRRRNYNNKDINCKSKSITIGAVQYIYFFFLIYMNNLRGRQQYY